MTIKEICDAYAKEFSYEKQCMDAPQKLAEFNKDHRIETFFEKMFLTDDIKKLLQKVKLKLFVEVKYWFVNIVIYADNNSILNGFEIWTPPLFQLIKRKRPDGNGVVWCSCKIYDENLEQTDTPSSYLKSIILSNIKDYLNCVIHESLQAIHESLQEVEATQRYICDCKELLSICSEYE